MDFAEFNGTIITSYRWVWKLLYVLYELREFAIYSFSGMSKKLYLILFLKYTRQYQYKLMESTRNVRKIVLKNFLRLGRHYPLKI